MSQRRRVAAPLAAACGAALSAGLFGAPAPDAAARYAIRDARIVTMAAAPLDKGTVVVRDGLIEDVGASVTVPADAVVIDGAGLTVYPGFIDMANSSAVEAPEPAAAAGGGRGGGGAQTLADLERARRAVLLRPDFEAASSARVGGEPMQQLASAGITTVLAVPGTGLVRGQSALVNVIAPPEPPQISGLADYRRGLVVVKAPVAQHVAFTAGGARGGGGYPGALLGSMAFVRQALHDARWQRDARAFAAKHPDQPRPVFEPVLDALAPMLDRSLPAAFEANLAVEIERALALAKEFMLDPIIVGGAEAGEVAAELKASGARVIYALNFPVAPESGRGGRGGRGGNPADEPIRVVRARENAPRGPAALASAGVPFAFTTGGLQDLSRFLRNAARTVSEGGLPADAALAALTSGAARLAGVADRLGTIQRGRIANLVVTDGDWTAERTRVRHVFIDGHPVEIDEPAGPPGEGGGGRRGGRGGPGR